MKKILITCLLWLWIANVYAGGGMTHMLLAQETIKQLSSAELRHLLQDNMDAYLVGAYYPDSGYIAENSYGEDSHWDPFIHAFADYIKETYPDPAIQQPKLLAFLFGCAAHRVSDEILHHVFFNVMKDKDFHGDYDKAHQYGDVGIDLLINIEKNQWLTHPHTWWVPINDLLAVYQRMGLTQYTKQEITWGNTVIYLAGYGERLISPIVYPYLKWKMPWTAKHYEDWAESGLIANEQKVADYQMRLWLYLKGQGEKPTGITRHYTESTANTAGIQFALKALKRHTLKVVTVANGDGSIELGIVKNRDDQAQQIAEEVGRGMD
ncbi:MAG: zinc dependent phospholipase C family protein [Gammaproteobacteria bacterium]